MVLDPATLPNDIAALKALLIAADARAIDLDGQIAQLKLTIAKMRRKTFGASSEKGARLLDQLELQLDELVASAAEAKAAAMIATRAPAPIDAEKEKPARRPLPAHLPRERVVHAAPCACRHCGSDRIRKLGEHTTETLERVPAHWKVITHVRETFTCRVCEKITETPSPSHPIARGRVGPQLLAEVLFAKYRAHLPLNRQSDIYAKEGIDLDVSTLAGWVGAAAATLSPARRRNQEACSWRGTHSRRRHDRAGARERKMHDRRLSAYVRDDLRFGGKAAHAALFYYSPDRPGRTSGKASRRLLRHHATTPTPVITAFSLKAVNQAPSWKRPVGPMGGASFSSSPTYKKRPSPSRPCGAWMSCSPSSATSMDDPPAIATRCARSDQDRWSRR